MGRKKHKPDRFIEPEVKAKVKADANWTCWYCGKMECDGAKLTLDHYVPFSRGGSNDEDNLVCACEDCNRLKAYMMPEEFRIFLYNQERYMEMAYGQLQRILAKQNG